MSKAITGLRFVALASAGALALAACGGGDDNSSSPGTSGSSGGSAQGQKGGTLTIFTLDEQFTHLDPQRNYTGEDLAFSSGYLTRTLTAFKLSKDGEQANTVVPDLATDTGKPSDGAKTWTFTLRDGVKWEDGSDVTCADIKYGVSRTFAQTVITDGPTYAISLLDIPKDADGNSTYKGPYETSKNDTAAFDKAVACSPDGKTITFHLNQPAGDFNNTVTLAAFAPVPKAKDTGEKYDDKIVSNGPYKITEYTKGQQLVLDRNPNWSADTDAYRPAYPDKIVMKFGVSQQTGDQRLMADAGEDQSALSRDNLSTSSLTTVFNDPRFADRRVNEYDTYAKKLIQESGQPMPTITYDYNQTPDNDKGAAAVQSSLAKAGITVKLNPIEQGKYYPTVQDPKKENELALAGWGADWPNASTVIPELFTPNGGFKLSLANDKAFNDAVAKAKAETDRAKQGEMWKNLNKQAMANAWVIPTRFGREQRLAGSKVAAGSGDGKVYIWSPYGSWSYADLYVKK